MNKNIGRLCSLRAYDLEIPLHPHHPWTLYYQIVGIGDTNKSRAAVWETIDCCHEKG
jgi:hypothetical protein